jgi:MFS family permease
VVKQRSFTTACGVYLFSYAALTAVYFYLTLLYQDVDGWSALRTGLSWLFLNVPFLVVAQLAGRLNRRLSPRAVVAGGCLVTAAAVITLSTLTRSSPFSVTVIGYVIFGAGTGMWIPGVANVAMRDVPPGLSGTASGVFNASRQVGTSIGLAVLGAIGADTARSAWDTHVSLLSGAARQAARAQAHSVASAQIGQVTRALGTGQRAAAEQAFSDGYEVAVLVAGLCLIAAALIAVFGLRESRRLDLDAVGAQPAPPADPGTPGLAVARGVAERPGSDADLVDGLSTSGEGGGRGRIRNTA